MSPSTNNQDDGFLHVWECPHPLPSGDLCGYIQGGPGDGYCPYDHPERVKLVEIGAYKEEAGDAAFIADCEARGIEPNDILAINVTSNGSSIEVLLTTGAADVDQVVDIEIKKVGE